MPAWFLWGRCGGELCAGRARGWVCTRVSVRAGCEPSPSIPQFAPHHPHGQTSGGFGGLWGRGEPGVVLGERGGGEASPACALRFPPPSPRQRAFCAAGIFFFPPLLIPNQEIKGRQRLRLFPLCRDLESSGRGEPSLSRRLGAGGRAAQVEGPGPGGTPGGTPGGDTQALSP